MAYSRNNRKKSINSFKWLFSLALLGAIAFLVITLEKDELDQPLRGFVTASDGDSLKMGSQQIRLLGIDAPELYQKCKFKNGKTWECGRVSHSRVSQLVKGKELVCIGDQYDRYNRLLAKCSVRDKDIGGILVLEGLAVSYRGSGDYLSEQKNAQRNNSGMWSGEFENPQDWRRNNPRN